MTSPIGKYTFDTQTLIGLGSGNYQLLLPAINLSRFDEIFMEVVISTSENDPDDTLNIYLQSRGQSGTWDDRIASAQFLGNGADALVRNYTLQSLGTLSDTEEASTPSGSTGGSRLTAGTVKNGAFPGLYRNKGVGTESSWRLDFQQVDGTGTDDTAFVGYIILSGNSGDQGKVFGK